MRLDFCFVCFAALLAACGDSSEQAADEGGLAGAGQAGKKGGQAGGAGASGQGGAGQGGQAGSGAGQGGVSGGSGQAGAGSGAGQAGQAGSGAGGAGQSGAGQGGAGQAGSGQAGSAGAGQAGAAGQGAGAGAGGQAGSGGAGGQAGAGAGGAGQGGAGAGQGPLGTALLDGGTPRALYPVKAAGGPRAIAYRQEGTTLSALDEAGAVLWSKEVGQGGLFGGFDFDGDGYTDAGLVRSGLLGVDCGSTPQQKTWLDVVSGKTGQVTGLTSPLDDKCWNFSGTIYPTRQWTDLGVLFGPGKTLVAAPYYATQGNFFSWQGAGFADLGVFYYPSTSSFDATYPAAKLNAYANGQKFIENAHVANGLIASVAGQERAVFFTSGRVVQYAVGPLGAGQLVHDAPFLTGGRTDIAGRNYGLVAVDQASPGRLSLISGTSAASLLSDMQTGKMEYDAWGQIERHVAWYDLASSSVEDRFFSYAHDAGDGHKYEGRVVYPAGAHVRVEGSASRLAFNVYEGGRWFVHVTKPGSTADDITLKDWFLWDVRDLDGDGVDEWALSPSHDPTDPDVPGFYFLKWRTVFARWDEATRSLSMGAPHQGALPRLVMRFREAQVTSSMSSLDAVSTAAIDGALSVLLVTSAGAIEPLAVSSL